MRAVGEGTLPARVALARSMSGRSQRQHAREAVATYHEARLSELVTHVTEAIDRFRKGELDAFSVDHVVVFQYSRAAKELWKFCNMTDVEMTARLTRGQPTIDWWERGAPKKR
jgi:hypothetical protein